MLPLKIVRIHVQFYQQVLAYKYSALANGAQYTSSITPCLSPQSLVRDASTSRHSDTYAQKPPKPAFTSSMRQLHSLHSSALHCIFRAQQKSLYILYGRARMIKKDPFPRITRHHSELNLSIQCPGSTSKLHQHCSGSCGSYLYNHIDLRPATLRVAMRKLQKVGNTLSSHRQSVEHSESQLPHCRTKHH